MQSPDGGTCSKIQIALTTVLSHPTQKKYGTVPILSRKWNILYLMWWVALFFASLSQGSKLPLANRLWKAEECVELNYTFIAIDFASHGNCENTRPNLKTNTRLMGIRI